MLQTLVERQEAIVRLIILKVGLNLSVRKRQNWQTLL